MMSKKKSDMKDNKLTSGSEIRWRLTSWLTWMWSAVSSLFTSFKWFREPVMPPGPWRTAYGVPEKRKKGEKEKRST